VSCEREVQPGGSPAPIPALFAHLVDDTSLLLPSAARPPMRQALSHYLATRDGTLGGLTGQLVCPVSRLPELVTELVKLRPTRPVALSLVVDTGLGAVPKALSLALSRESILSPRTVETAAPPDVDSVWLERVSEFVPDDVLPVVEPRRPLNGDTAQWLDAVRRVAGHGCTPKLRCGGPRGSDVPSVGEVAEFIMAADGAPAGFTTSIGLRAVRRRGQHGVLNLLVAAARALVHGDVAGALAETDGERLAREVGALSDGVGGAVRGVLARCGTGHACRRVTELAALVGLA
jgi:hypothetical protein